MMGGVVALCPRLVLGVVSMPNCLVHVLAPAHPHPPHPFPPWCQHAHGPSTTQMGGEGCVMPPPPLSHPHCPTALAWVQCGCHCHKPEHVCDGRGGSRWPIKVGQGLGGMVWVPPWAPCPQTPHPPPHPATPAQAHPFLVHNSKSHTTFFDLIGQGCWA